MGLELGLGAIELCLGSGLARVKLPLTVATYAHRGQSPVGAGAMEGLKQRMVRARLGCPRRGGPEIAPRRSVRVSSCRSASTCG